MADPTYLALTQEQLDQFIARVQPHPNHDKHHDFVQMLIDDRARRAALWQKFQTSLVGGVALAVLGALGWAGNLVLQALVSHK